MPTQHKHVIHGWCRNPACPHKNQDGHSPMHSMRQRFCCNACRFAAHNAKRSAERAAARATAPRAKRATRVAVLDGDRILLFPSTTAADLWIAASCRDPNTPILPVTCNPEPEDHDDDEAP